MSADNTRSSVSAAGRSWSAFFPPAQWLARYQLPWLRSDIVAGVTLAAYGIPVSLAYATLAGLPPQYGIYCYLVAGPAYALFGSSRQLAIGPTSAISMLVAVRSLINVPELLRVRRLSRMEFRVAMAAFAGVLLLG